MRFLISCWGNRFATRTRQTYKIRSIDPDTCNETMTRLFFDHNLPKEKAIRAWPPREENDAKKLNDDITTTYEESSGKNRFWHTSCFYVFPLRRNADENENHQRAANCSTKGMATGGIAEWALCYTRASAYLSSRLLFFSVSSKAFLPSADSVDDTNGMNSSHTRNRL